MSTFFAKQPKWEIKRFDLVCGLLSIIGFILWIAFGEANFAIVFAILADGLAFLPTLLKAYKYPETENPWTFMMGTIAALIAVAVVTTHDFKHLAFPLYILVVDIMAILFIFGKTGKGGMHDIPRHKTTKL
jgi:hypothetical protein